ncbi:MAG: hypothetical protein ACE5LB_05470 [Acidiferrobacterales bacterium]
MNTADEYPTLHADLATVKDIINPGFIRADRVALRLQRYFRLSEMILIIGAVIAAAKSWSACGKAIGKARSPGRNCY